LIEPLNVLLQKYKLTRDERTIHNSLTLPQHNF